MQCYYFKIKPALFSFYMTRAFANSHVNDYKIEKKKVFEKLHFIKFLARCEFFSSQIHDLNYSVFGLPKCSLFLGNKKISHTYVRFKCFINHYVNNTCFLNVVCGKVASLFSQPPQSAFLIRDIFLRDTAVKEWRILQWFLPLLIVFPQRVFNMFCPCPWDTNLIFYECS